MGRDGAVRVIGRTLAVDYGSRRVGLAVCDALGITTRPLGAIDRRRTLDVVAAIVAVAHDEAAHRILVGIPRLASGDEGVVAVPARSLAAALGAALGPEIEVITTDEGNTSQEAASRLAAGRGGRGPRRGESGRPADKGAIDAAAAAVMLESWLRGQMECGPSPDDTADRGETVQIVERAQHAESQHAEYGADDGR